MPIPKTTYQPTLFLSEVLQGSVIPEGKLAYFRARLSNRLHELVLSTFLKVERRDHISRADLAKRIGRKPEQITRWFASPGNWTLDTVSDLLLAMSHELEPRAVGFEEKGFPTVASWLIDDPTGKSWAGMPKIERYSTAAAGG